MTRHYSLTHAEMAPAFSSLTPSEPPVLNTNSCSAETLPAQDMVSSAALKRYLQHIGYLGQKKQRRCLSTELARLSVK